MRSDPQVLADTLTSVTEVEYVRFVAHWMTHADNLGAAPVPTGNRTIDALVAAAAAHVAFTAGNPVPAWTEERGRFLGKHWHPGGKNGFYANALEHSPLMFKNHGILIEADSLVCV